MYVLVRQYTLCTEHEDVLGFIPSYVLYSKQIGNVYARCCLQETLLLSDNLFFGQLPTKQKFKIKSFLFRLSCVLQIKRKQCRKLHQNTCTEIKNCVRLYCCVCFLASIMSLQQRRQNLLRVKCKMRTARINFGR